ncbi:hypothetical protein F1737_09555 [Methanoplanus sp. FWC-SCC4]|uniref:Dret-0059-like sensor domain-containing protein n=1 Tax=Methanochimaera problematica TaxID=2609417 RepID=A0AA97FCE8_9EURY|nr:PDC sensor domain-containing protein [Methanoplanus sp. FWC-SCC4]WOF16915.1 hypothetical protein F1737_09555 [Methanoplanus sp. FWC-SCC4]
MSKITDVAIFLTASVVVFVILFFAGFSIINPSPDPENSPDIQNEMMTGISDFQGYVQEGFYELNEIASSAAERISKTGLDGEGTEKILEEYMSKNPSIVTIGTFDGAGYVKAMVPVSHQEIVGKDLGNTPVVSLMNSRKVPLMTDQFDLAEGGKAASINYPVFTGDDRYAGFVSLTFDPAIMFGDILKKNFYQDEFQFMAVQKNGVILYDEDPEEIGKNTFKDPMYEDYPEISGFGEQFAEKWSGRYVYRFTDPGSLKEAKKEAFWTTCGIHGTEWRIMIIKTL